MDTPILYTKFFNDLLIKYRDASRYITKDLIEDEAKFRLSKEGSAMFLIIRRNGTISSDENYYNSPEYFLSVLTHYHEEGTIFEVFKLLKVEEDKLLYCSVPVDFLIQETKKYIEKEC